MHWFSPQLTIDRFSLMMPLSIISAMLQIYRLFQSWYIIFLVPAVDSTSYLNIVSVKLTCGNTGKLARVISQARPSFRTIGDEDTGVTPEFCRERMMSSVTGIITTLESLILQDVPTLPVPEFSSESIPGREVGSRGRSWQNARPRYHESGFPFYHIVFRCIGRRLPCFIMDIPLFPLKSN